ncbi:MAG TPA: DUF4097 family beta strand repeat-containing protein [Candidatus Acidoferrum sp.]|nr:DUF4097 family beta strand repeat-containing protein [Candidatus Acidoferrum sp.]
MPNPAPSRSLFPGLALLFVGVLLLVHNYRGLDISHLFHYWWPLIIIFWGAIKLYERTMASRSGQSASTISGGEILLVLGLLSLLGIVAASDVFRSKFGGLGVDWPRGGERFNFDLNVEPKPVLSDARVTIRNERGDITVRSSEESQVRVDGKKNVNAWSETDAEHLASAVSVEIAKSGDAYEIRPVNAGSAGSRVSLDMDISVPKKASLTVHNDHGDVSVSDMNKPVIINTTTGDVEVRDTSSDVTIDTQRGDVKVSDTKGNVKIGGRGGEVNVSGATGALTLDGEFRGPVRADKIAKGVHFTSHRTDLTITQLSGHMETGSGNLEIADAPGNLTLRTNSYDISIENAGGKVKVENRNGNIEVRFPTPPKEDIEITNSSSPITLILPESSSFEIGADCHSCDIASEFSADSLKQTSNGGDSHLEGKYGNVRGPKIILKTTYGSISIRKTS